MARERWSRGGGALCGRDSGYLNSESSRGWPETAGAGATARGRGSSFVLPLPLEFSVAAARRVRHWRGERAVWRDGRVRRRGRRGRRGPSGRGVLYPGGCQGPDCESSLLRGHARDWSLAGPAGFGWELGVTWMDRRRAGPAWRSGGWWWTAGVTWI